MHHGYTMLDVVVHEFGEHEYTTFYIRLDQPKKKYNKTVIVSDGNATIVFSSIQ